MEHRQTYKSPFYKFFFEFYSTGFISVLHVMNFAPNHSADSDVKESGSLLERHEFVALRPAVQL